jgi:hypothetical protein
VSGPQQPAHRAANALVIINDRDIDVSGVAHGIQLSNRHAGPSTALWGRGEGRGSRLEGKRRKGGGERDEGKKRGVGQGARRGSGFKVRHSTKRMRWIWTLDVGRRTLSFENRAAAFDLGVREPS